MEIGKGEPVSFIKLVGLNIKHHRLRKGLSMDGLGLEIGATRWDIRRIERGRNITLVTIRKLSLALEMPPWDLLKVNCSQNMEELEMLINTSKAYKIKKIIG